MAEQTVIHEEETEIVVKRQNFDNAMQTIKVFADDAKRPEKIGWLKETGFLGIKKTAKAEDLNDVIAKVNTFQSGIQDFNLGVLDIISDVYTALDALDREHIAAILIAANAAKRASKEATKTVANINLVVEVLKQFKEDLDKLKHLTDVDKAWELLEGQDKLLKSLSSYKTELSRIRHLRDVDKLWDDQQEQAKAIERITKIIEDINKALAIQSKGISSITESISGISNQQNAFIDATNRMLSEKMYAIDQSMDTREKSMQESFLLLSEEHKKKQEALDRKLSEFFTAQKEAISTLRKEQAEGIAGLERAQSECLDRIHKEQADALVQITKSQNASLKEIEAAQAVRLDQIERNQANSLSTIAIEQANSLAAINKALEKEKATLSSKVSELAQKAKTAYIIAGGTAGVALIHLILNVLGVI